MIKERGAEISFADFVKAPVEYKHANTGIEDTEIKDKAIEDSTQLAEPSVIVAPPVMERPKVADILGVFRNGVGLDISKNHTGVAIWNEGVLETLGFAVDMDYDKNSYLAEARMRLEFKKKLEELLKDRRWEVCIVEDVYGGFNFETTRKLLALNCVIDELVLEERVKIDNIYRFKESEWIKDLRKIYKVGNKLNPKYECQKILEYLSFDLIEEFANARVVDKERAFFEDRCDAAGQLLGLAMRLNSQDRAVKSSSVKLQDLKMYFIEDEDEISMISDEILLTHEVSLQDYPTGENIEDALLALAEEHPNEVVSIMVSNQTLGIFGVKNGFTFFTQGFGFLVFYNKRRVKKK